MRLSRLTWLALLTTSLVVLLAARSDLRAAEVVQPAASDTEESAASEDAPGLDTPEEEPAYSPSPFGPRYHLERIDVRGNHKTETPLILGEIGLVVGDDVAASDPRVEAARIRLLSLGYFLDARLALERGEQRGGAVLVVDVEERGTVILNALHLGSSEATPFWGGLDIAENNFLGRGISLGGGFVASTHQNVAAAQPSGGLRLRTLVPPLGNTGFMLTGTALASAGSEFFRAPGVRDADQRDNPENFVAMRIRRVGGVVGVGRGLTQSTRLFIDFREEGVSTTLPPANLVTPPPGSPPITIDYDLLPSYSRVGTLTATLEYDTRSDPLVPRAGTHLVFSSEVGAEQLGSSYEFVKLLVQGSTYKPVWRRHIIGVHVFGGAIFGQAPIFDRFFVGDLDLFLPPRALGLNFSTEAARNPLHTAIAEHRFDDFAGRVLVEYSIPLWRRHKMVYSGDVFAAVGAFGMTSRRSPRAPEEDNVDRDGFHALPISVTGDLGVRLDTYIGVFTLSIGNAVGRMPF